MESRKEILERVNASAQGAERWARDFDALTERSCEAALPIFRGYVREKFLLDETDGGEENIAKLAELSLEKVLQLRREGRTVGDSSRGCASASSAVTKKVLLMKAVQDDFHVRFSPRQSADIRTLQELTEAVVSRRGNRDEQS